MLTLRKTNVKDSDFKQPRALATKEGKEVFAGTCYGHSIYLFDISIKDSTATCILKLQIKEIITVMGLTFQSDTGELYVANRRNLLIVRSRKLGFVQDTVSPVSLPGCSSYLDVSLSISGKLAVSDTCADCVRIYIRDDFDFQCCDKIGIESDRIMDGATSKATLQKPIGVEFIGEAMYICCYKSGLKLFTYTRLAIEYCKQVEKIYLACGYKASEDEEQVPFSTGMKLMGEACEFMKSLNEKRRQQLNRKYISAEHGGMYQPTINCLEDTVKSITTVSEALQRNGCDIDSLNMYAFTNESPVEHGFGFGVQQGQYSVLSQQQYAKQKVRSSDDIIRRCCENSFNYPITSDRQYKEPLQFNIKSSKVFEMRAKVLEPRVLNKKRKKSKRVKKDMKDLELITQYFRPQPTQGVRAKYKARPGFAPTVTTFESLAQVDDHPDFETLYAPSAEGATASTSNTQPSIIEAGDIVGVLPGDDQGEVSTDNWWIFKVLLLVFLHNLIEATKPFIMSIVGPYIE